jgi:hypothetical protein
METETEQESVKKTKVWLNTGKGADLERLNEIMCTLCALEPHADFLRDIIYGFPVYDIPTGADFKTMRASGVTIISEKIPTNSDKLKFRYSFRSKAVERILKSIFTKQYDLFMHPLDKKITGQTIVEIVRLYS